MATSDLTIPGAQTTDAHALEDQRFTSAFREHHQAIWRYLRRMGVPATDADDALQEVFMVARTKLAAVAQGKEAGFLFVTARKMASTYRRRAHAADRVHESDEVLESHPIETASSDFEHAESMRILDGFLLQLDDSLREVLILCDIEGMSRAQASAALELPEGTIASRLRKAREMFSKVIRKFQKAQALVGVDHE